MVGNYLQEREQLKLTLMLVDSRIPPTESDIAMKTWLDHHRIPNAVVMTKIDKISRNQLNQALRTGAQTLKTKEIIAFSAVTGAGTEELLSKIGTAVQNPTQ